MHNEHVVYIIHNSDTGKPTNCTSTVHVLSIHTQCISMI